VKLSLKKKTKIVIERLKIKIIIIIIKNYIPMGFVGSLTGGKCNLAEKTEERERERGRDRMNRASQTKPPPLHSIKPHLFSRSLVSSPLLSSFTSSASDLL
jgi:hypothetical protein